MRLTDEEFEGAVADALDSIPDDLFEQMDNVVVLVQDEPEDYQLEEDFDATYAGDDLLGLYDGVSLAERGESYGAGMDYPDTIYIFKGPHERLGLDLDGTLEEVRKTVIHEVGHFFGMDEDQIDKMGYA